MPSRTIIIAGTGPAGTALAYHFYQAVYLSGDSNWTVKIIDPAGAECGGPAFSAEDTRDSATLCNMPALTMSITREPMDFVNWLALNKLLPAGSVPKAFYAKRHHFGMYLTEHLKNAIALMRQLGVEVEVIKAQVEGISSQNSRWRLLLSNGQSTDADNVILATGGFRSNAYPHLQNSPRAIAHAYPFRQLAAIPSNANVVVAGSSLTFIDVVTTLEEMNFKGTVYTTSTTGVYPSIRRDYEPEHKVAHCTPEALQSYCDRWGLELSVSALLRAFEQDCADYGVPAERAAFLSRHDFIDQVSLINRLQQEMARVDVTDRLFTVLSGLCAHLPEIWKMLPEEERRLFSKTFASKFNATAFPCPPENGAKLLRWLKTGRVRALGTVSAKSRGEPPIRETPEGIEVLCDDGTRTVVDYFINATGLSFDLNSDVAPDLHKALVRHDILVPNGTLGAKVDFISGAALKPDGSRNEGLYIVGPLTRGVHYYTNSVAMNSKAAERAVQDIMVRNFSYGSAA